MILYIHTGGNELTANLCHGTSRKEFQTVCVFAQSRPISLKCYIPGNAIVWKSQGKVPLLTDIPSGHPDSNENCRIGSAVIEPKMLDLLNGNWVSCSDPTNVNIQANFSFIVLGRSNL